MRGRTTTALGVGIRELGRTPILLALLIFLPVYYIGAFMYIVPDATLPMAIAGETVQVALPDGVGVLVTPLTAALLTGVVGLFLMQSARAADDRLHLAGYRASELVLSRVGVLAVGATVVTVVSVGVLLVGYSPVSFLGFAVASLLAALVYGVIGVILGLTVSKLAGIYVLLFGSITDLLILQNPLATETPLWVRFTPGYYPMRAATDAAFGQGLQLVNFLGAGVYLGGLLVVGSLVFYRATVV